MTMPTVHSFDLGDYVTIFQMHPRRGLLIEGRAAIVDKVDDVDEQFVVRFENEQDETYERFVDRDGQDNPEQYVREFNKKIGYAA
jgi:hypothetical protein